MGNRAVITSNSSDENKTGIYLHWNGGPESVKAFLQAARELGVRGPITDEAYCYARLTQIIANWLGGTLSIGVGPVSQLDCNGDNGVYEINDRFEIVNRKEPTRTSTEVFKEVMAVNRPIFGLKP